MVFAYLQRKDIMVSKGPKVTMKCYIYSLIISVQIFSIIGIVKKCKPLKYGWKIWPGEYKYNKWYFNQIQAGKKNENYNSIWS